jgi:hypothetical protein
VERFTIYAAFMLPTQVSYVGKQGKPGPLARQNVGEWHKTALRPHLAADIED